MNVEGPEETEPEYDILRGMIATKVIQQSSS